MSDTKITNIQIPEMKLEATGKTVKGKAVLVQIPDFVEETIKRGIAMRMKAYQMAEEAAKLKEESDLLLMPSMIVGEIKSILTDNFDQFTYREGQKNSPTHPMEDFKKALLKGGVLVDVINKAFEACAKPPKKDRGDPSIIYTPRESYLSKREAKSKKDQKEE